MYLVRYLYYARHICSPRHITLIHMNRRPPPCLPPSHVSIPPLDYLVKHPNPSPPPLPAHSWSRSTRFLGWLPLSVTVNLNWPTTSDGIQKIPGWMPLTLTGRAPRHLRTCLSDCATSNNWKWGGGGPCIRRHPPLMILDPKILDALVIQYSTYLPLSCSPYNYTCPNTLPTNRRVFYADPM